MRVYEYGDPKAEIVLIQPTGAHELAELESEVAEIGRLTGVSFWFLAYPVNDWNCALSPWKAPAVFGNEGFGEGSAATLTEISADIRLPGCLLYGRLIRRMYSPELRQRHHLSGSPDS